MKKTTTLLLLVLALGCGPQSGDSAPEPAEQPAVNPSAEDGGTAGIQGTVRFEGEVPPQGELQMDGNPECRALHPAGKVPAGDVLVHDGLVENVFVYVKEGLEGKTFETPADPVVIDNHGCTYQPHVAGALVNQPIELRNSDPTLHNVHAYPQTAKQWNVGLPFQGMKLNKKFSGSEIMVKLKCDVHPWMVGYLGVLPHPYFAVTGKDGKFEFKNLPARNYTLEVWHERFGTQTSSVTLVDGQTGEANFMLKNPGAA